VLFFADKKCLNPQVHILTTWRLSRRIRHKWVRMSSPLVSSNRRSVKIPISIFKFLVFYHNFAFVLQRNGFFIECGAADGEYLSNSLLLEKEFGWTGLLVEASPALAQPLRDKHRKAWTSSACLSTKPYPQMVGLSRLIIWVLRNWVLLTLRFRKTVKSGLKYLILGLFSFLHPISFVFFFASN